MEFVLNVRELVSRQTIFSTTERETKKLKKRSHNLNIATAWKSVKPAAHLGIRLLFEWLTVCSRLEIFVIACHVCSYNLLPFKASILVQVAVYAFVCWNRPHLDMIIFSAVFASVGVRFLRVAVTWFCEGSVITVLAIVTIGMVRRVLQGPCPENIDQTKRPTKRSTNRPRPRASRKHATKASAVQETRHDSESATLREFVTLQNIKDDRGSHSDGQVTSIPNP